MENYCTDLYLCLQKHSHHSDQKIKCYLLLIVHIDFFFYTGLKGKVRARPIFLFININIDFQYFFLNMIESNPPWSQMSFTPLWGLSAALQCLYVGCCCCFHSCWSTTHPAGFWLPGSGMEGRWRRRTSPSLCGSTGALRWHPLQSFGRGWWKTRPSHAPTRFPARPCHDKQSSVWIYLDQQRQERGGSRNEALNYTKISQTQLLNVFSMTNRHIHKSLLGM